MDYDVVVVKDLGVLLDSERTFTTHVGSTAEADPGVGFGGLTPPPRTAQLIAKFGEKVLQIDYRCCK